jgi:hypothetical protein
MQGRLVAQIRRFRWIRAPNAAPDGMICPIWYVANLPKDTMICFQFTPNTRTPADAQNTVTRYSVLQ